MQIEQARRYALSLPETTEEPHHQMSSFRVRGKIFATLPADGIHLHVFVDEEDRAPLIAAVPAAYEPLWWGKQVRGLRVVIANADILTVARMLGIAWRRKAPKALSDAMPVLPDDPRP